MCSFRETWLELNDINKDNTLLSLRIVRCSEADRVHQGDCPVPPFNLLLFQSSIALKSITFCTVSTDTTRPWCSIVARWKYLSLDEERRCCRLQHHSLAFWKTRTSSRHSLAWILRLQVSWNMWRYTLFAANHRCICSHQFKAFFLGPVWTTSSPCQRGICWSTRWHQVERSRDSLTCWQSSQHGTLTKRWCLWLGEWLTRWCEKGDWMAVGNEMSLFFSLQGPPEVMSLFAESGRYLTFPGNSWHC